MIPSIFPDGEWNLRYAAWEMYLRHAEFADVYRILRPQYETAIGDLKKFKKERRFFADPTERLAQHMVIAFAYRMGGGEDKLPVRFFRTATAQQRGMAVSFAGRAYLARKEEQSGEKFPELSRLQEFWEWRLRDSKDIEELREFGWWVVGDKFNPEWMLQHFIETLQKTAGEVEADFHVLATLAGLSKAHPLLCSQALLLIVRCRKVNRVTLGHGDDIEAILKRIQSSENDDAKSQAAIIVDHLTKLGFERYRSIFERATHISNNELNVVTGKTNRD
jgi:hypothetical protein